MLKGVDDYACVIQIWCLLCILWSDKCTPREEVHIHISEGKPTKDEDKFWLTESGYFVPDKHNSKLQKRTCTKILENLSNQEFIDILEGKMV